jgi:nephrocystin-3
MNICLAEVDRCRPYFVGLLGQRYGWSQPTPRSKETGLLNEADQLLKKTFDRAQINYPWLGDYRDRSVTELEVSGVHSAPYIVINEYLLGPTCRVE